MKYFHVGTRQAAEASSNGRFQLGKLAILGYGEGSASAKLDVFGLYDAPNRVSYGTPTMGHFPTAGEVIGNINFGGSEPFYFVVDSPGVLTKSWAISTTYEEGELVENDGEKIYVARNNRTSAEAGGGPTGTTTGITDNDITWDYYKPEAVIRDSSYVFTNSDLRP